MQSDLWRRYFMMYYTVSDKPEAKQDCFLNLASCFLVWLTQLAGSSSYCIPLVANTVYLAKYVTIALAYGLFSTSYHMRSASLNASCLGEICMVCMTSWWIVHTCAMIDDWWTSWDYNRWTCWNSFWLYFHEMLKGNLHYLNHFHFLKQGLFSVEIFTYLERLLFSEHFKHQYL